MLTEAFIDDFQIHETESYGLRSVGGFGAPPPRREVFDRPRRHGSVDVTEFYEGRVFSLLGYVAGDTVGDVHAALDALKGTLALGSPHVFRWRRQEFPEDEEAAEVRVASPLEVELVSVRLVVPWAVDLHAPDPRLYATAEKSATYDPNSAGSGKGVEFPLVFPLVFVGETTTHMQIVNQGTFPTPPVWTITGPALNPQIANDTTGESIYTVGLDLSAGSTLVIDVAARSVLLDGASRPDLIDPGQTTWYELPQGTSLIRMTGSGFTASSELAVSFHDARI